MSDYTMKIMGVEVDTTRRAVGLRVVPDGVPEIQYLRAEIADLGEKSAAAFKAEREAEKAVAKARADDERALARALRDGKKSLKPSEPAALEELAAIRRNQKTLARATGMAAAEAARTIDMNREAIEARARADIAAAHEDLTAAADQLVVVVEGVAATIGLLRWIRGWPYAGLDVREPKLHVPSGSRQFNVSDVRVMVAQVIPGHFLEEVSWAGEEKQVPLVHSREGGGV